MTIPEEPSTRIPHIDFLTSRYAIATLDDPVTSMPARAVYPPSVNTGRLFLSAAVKTIGLPCAPLTEETLRALCWPGSKANTVPGLACASAASIGVFEKPPPLACPLFETLTGPLSTGAAVVVGALVAGDLVVRGVSAAVVLGAAVVVDAVVVGACVVVVVVESGSFTVGVVSVVPSTMVSGS